MAQNDTVTLTAATWTQITNGDVSSITFQNRGLAGSELLEPALYVMATASASAPSTLDGAIRYERGQGERNVALSDLFPGVTSPVRLYGYSTDAIDVQVSHA